MAAEILTPIDAETGIPFPILPRSELPLVLQLGARNVERVADLHHPFHPRVELVGGSTGEQAIRDCRVQWSLYSDHHYGYHPNFSGPPLPGTDDGRFRTVVFAAAGFVPAQALAFDRSNKPRAVSIDDAQREVFWQSGQLRVANRTSVSRFLAQHALRHDFSGIKNALVDEFLHTADDTRRRELGRHFIALATHDAACGIYSTYRQSKANGLLPPNAARTAGRFVFELLVRRSDRQTMKLLTSKLQTAT